MKPAVSGFFRLNVEYHVRSLLATDVTKEYVGWLNDPNTIKFLAQRTSVVTKSSQQAYVRRIIESETDAIFGLFDDDSRLIGTSGVQKLGGSNDGGPWVGILIGPAECRGLGLGTALVWIVSSLLFRGWGVRAVYANMLVTNVASYRAFRAVGYRDLAAAGNRTDLASKTGGRQVATVCCREDDLVRSEKVGIADLRFSTA